MSGINVLSLFDGMSCGRIALERAGIKVNRYYASEIDKYAIKVSKANYPDIIHIGDVKQVSWFGLPAIDLLIGGSPCQGFSNAGLGYNFNDPRSALFFEYVRILLETKPRYFLLENVKMKKEWQDIISGFLGVEPIKINSALVSAQNRERLYWTNIPGITQPDDRGILLKDIIEDGEVDRNKSYAVLPGMNHRASYNHYHNHRMHQIVFSGGAMRGRYLDNNGKHLDSSVNSQAGLTEQRFEIRKDEKSNCLTTVEKNNILIMQTPRGNNPGGLRALDGKVPSMTANSWHENNKLTNGIYWRKLTPVECERLQTVEDNYTAHVSNSQRYKMLGNGWTVDVVAHILSFLPKAVAMRKAA